MTLDAQPLRVSSEYSRLVEAVWPLLDVLQFTEIADLWGRPKEALFLAGETGADEHHISSLIAAHAFARIAGVPAEVFYGLIREGLPAELGPLLTAGHVVQREALGRAVADRIIQAPGLQWIEQVVSRLVRARVDLAMKDRVGSGPSALAVILGTALSDEARKRSFLSRYYRRDGDDEAFWRNLRRCRMFREEGIIERIRFSLQLGEMTGGNATLVRHLTVDRKIASLRDLLDLDPPGWRQCIAATAGDLEESIPTYVGGSSLDERISRYAASMVRWLEWELPMECFRRAMARPLAIDVVLAGCVMDLNPTANLREEGLDHLEWGQLSLEERDDARKALVTLREELAMFPELDPKAALASGRFQNPVRDGVNTFLAGNPGFDFGEGTLDTYLAENRAQAFTGVEEGQRESVVMQLRAFERLYEITPRYSAMRALMNDGVDSASEVAELAPEEFLKTFQERLGGVVEAQCVYWKAVEIVERARRFPFGAPWSGKATHGLAAGAVGHGSLPIAVPSCPWASNPPPKAPAC